MTKNKLFISDDVSCNTINSFLKNNLKEKNYIHTLEVYYDNSLKVKIAVPPYDCEYKQQLYSLSKSYCSTAIGLLFDDGVISLDDRLIDLFPNKLPNRIGKKLSEMRIKHLLSMTTGHSACVLYKIKQTDDMAKAFFKQKIDYIPGTHFTYNSAATYMLSEIVTRYTGQSVFDFLNDRLFSKLGIYGTYWDNFNGISQGGVGFHASIDDVTKLGLLYYNHGLWNGEQILSASWIKAATRVQSETGTNGSSDWSSGYGYQFWKNSKDGYRADGAFGQLCMVLPNHKMVISVQALANNMQKEIDYVYELADKLFEKSDINSDTLKACIENMNLPCKTKRYVPEKKRYICDKNAFGITELYFNNDGDDIELNFSNGSYYQKIVSGYEKYRNNTIYIRNMKPKIYGLQGHNNVEKVCFISFYTFENNQLKLHFRYLDNPHSETVICSFNAKKIDVFFDIEDSKIAPDAHNIFGKTESGML